MNPLDPNRNRVDPNEDRPLWEVDPSPSPTRPNPVPPSGRNPAPVSSRPPAASQDPPWSKGSAVKSAWDRRSPSLLRWLAEAGRRCLAELVAIGRATWTVAVDLVIIAIRSGHVGFASIRVRRAQLQLGRKSLGQGATRRTNDPAWRTAERDGQALQRAATILNQGVVPPEAAFEFGRAIATQVAFEQASRARDIVRDRLRRGGIAQWVRFGVGVSTILLVAFFLTRSK